MSPSRWADTLWRDLRYALRGLRRSPLFTLVAIATLAIGTGANTAVFSVVDGVLLKPLPYPSPDRLVAVWHDAPGAPGLGAVSDGLRMSPSMLVTYQDENRSFEHIGIWEPAVAYITGLGEPEQVPAVWVSNGVLQALAVPPLLGRWLDAADQVAGPARIMISYGYWQRRFGGEPSVIGRNLTVSGESAQIVGVMPPGFRVLNSRPDVIWPERLPRTGLAPPPFCCSGVARLKPGVTIEQANADLERMLPIWLERFPFKGTADRSAEEVYLGTWRIAPALRPLKQDVVGNVGNVLWVVMGTIGVVLLIACANVANLLLVRAERRRRELAVRSALGAGAWRIVRALTIESLLLGLAGGGAGLVLAQGALVLIKRLAPATLPRIEDIALDGRALAFTLVVAVLAGCGLGLIPALRQAGASVGSALRGGQRGGTQGVSQHRTQNALVVAQVALALVLLVSSGLMIRTFAALRNVEPGFTDPQSLQIARIAIPPMIEPDNLRAARLENAMVEAIAGIPGVSAAGFVSSMPMEGNYSNWDDLDVEGRPRTADPSTSPIYRFKSVSPGLFRTAGIRLIAGRDLRWTDVYEDHPVVLVSENLAKDLWGSAAAAIGKRVRNAGNEAAPWRDVIGVVQDTHDNGLQEPAPMTVYWPPYMKTFYAGPADYTDRILTLVARTPQAGSQALIREMQKAVWSVNGDLPLAGVRTMQDVYDASLARTSFTLVMLAIAGSGALVLGVVGLYGVIAYAVSQHRREIAVRLALGALERDVIGDFTRRGLVLAAVGVAIGLAASIGLTRLMSALLFEIEPLDVPTYAVVALVLTLVATAASYLPARRASTVDPAEALAAE